MNHSVKVTSKGQITLPADIRRSLQIEAGDSVTIVQNASGHYELRGRPHTLADLKGIVKLDKPISSKALSRWVDEGRAAGYRDEGE